MSSSIMKPGRPCWGRLTNPSRLDAPAIVKRGSNLVRYSISSSAPHLQPKHLVGLDGIRFVLAAFVVLGHFGPHVGGEVMSSASRYARLLINNAFNGPAAVIAFFVISGLCIHYPNRHRESVPLLPFYVRREVRILIPVALMLALSIVLSVPMAIFHDSILWSLICEEIYYLIYPLFLLRLIRRVGIVPMVIASFVMAYTVVIVQPSPSGNYPSFGPALNWLVGLPCWLLGCLIAEQQPTTHAMGQGPSRLALTLVRFAVLGASIVLQALRFHTSLTYPWTLNLFAILCFFWLKTELAFYRTRKPWPLLERFGLGSYSVYLVHIHAHRLWTLLGIPASTYLEMPFIGACAYVFYRFVEAPSHRLARKTHLMFTTKVVAPGPAATESIKG
jgi:peptidoglycan/LPS O-acetylase OafA/YrhL